MMTGTESTVNSVVWRRSEEEEATVNLAKGEYWHEDKDGWRTPDDSWLELEHEELVMQVYHVTVVMGEE
jgi:hypothetical protein